MYHNETQHSKYKEKILKANRKKDHIKDYQCDEQKTNYLQEQRTENNVPEGLTGKILPTRNSKSSLTLYKNNSKRMFFHDKQILNS